MNKVLCVVFSMFFLVGCHTYSKSVSDGVNSSNHDLNQAKLPSGIFTYYFDTNLPQPMVGKSTVGKFVVEDKCLMFEAGGQVFTPIFPVPFTEYKEGNDKIIVNKKIIHIGKIVDLDGLTVEKKYLKPFLTEGLAHCLTDDVIPIGLFVHREPHVIQLW